MGTGCTLRTYRKLGVFYISFNTGVYEKIIRNKIVFSHSKTQVLMVGTVNAKPEFQVPCFGKNCLNEIIKVGAHKYTG